MADAREVLSELIRIVFDEARHTVSYCDAAVRPAAVNMIKPASSARRWMSGDGSKAKDRVLIGHD